MHKLFENLNATDFSDMYKKRELLRKVIVYIEET